MSVTTDDVDESVVLETFLSLVRIDSPSGQEQALADHLEPLLRTLGFERGVSRTWLDRDQDEALV